MAQDWIYLVEESLDGSLWWVLDFGTFGDSMVEKPTRGAVTVGLRDKGKGIWGRPGGGDEP